MSSGSLGEYVRLTGQPRVFAGSAEVSFVPDKRYQLLSYLAYQGDWVGRDRLAFLFWPDTDSTSARQNLRALLQRLRSLKFGVELESTPHQLRWVVRTDVAEFRDAVARGDRESAASALHGSLLAGLEGDGSGEFEEWLEIERERLSADWRAVVLQRVRECGPDERGLARSLIDQVLAVDPLDEEAVRTYVKASSGTDGVSDARAVYRTFVARLGKEMGLEPTAETVAAYEELAEAEPQAGAGFGTLEQRPAANPAATSSGDAPSATVVVPLPKPHTTFVGRERELHDLEDLVVGDDCRLVTVMGPGGVGKTRLALAVARRLSDRFTSGAAFVGLDSVSSVEDVPQAMATALGITSTSGDALAQVTHALARTDMVLVLDNFEHVLGAVDVVSRVLDTCPAVKVLVTSRARLGLQPEWLFPLEGLGYPQQPGMLSEITGFDAVTLFLERARRVKPSFQVTAADAPVLVRLCSSLEGVPLAIELAASWARALPLEAIERDVSQNLDALTSTATDGVRRHASIRATFEQSWSFLTEAEQGALMRLAVFRSSVSPSAARFVAGASNVLLAALVDKSLLRLRSNGRYALHPLLRSFSLEKLQAFPEDLERAERRHAAYYLRFLRERSDAAKGPNPAPVVAEIDAEISEILAAVRAAHERGKAAQLVAFMRLLTADTGYLPARDYGSGWLVLMTAAADVAVENGWLTAAHILKGRVGDAYLALGDHQKALPWYREAAELAHEDGDDLEVIHLSLAGAMRSIIDGSAHDDLDKVLDRARADGNDKNLAVVLEQRAYVEAEIKDAWDESRTLHLEVLDVVDRVERRQGETPYWIQSMRYHALLNLGIIEQRQGRPEEAMELMRSAYAIAETSGNTLFIAGALGGLGEVYAALGDADLARQHLVRAHTLLTEIHALGDAQQLVTRAQTLGFDVSSATAES